MLSAGSGVLRVRTEAAWGKRAAEEHPSHSCKEKRL